MRRTFTALLTIGSLFVVTPATDAQTEKPTAVKEAVPKTQMRPDDLQAGIDLTNHALENIATNESEWSIAFEKLQKALEAQKQGYAVMVEAATATAMRDCALQIRNDGVQVIALYKELAERNGTLKSALFRGPKYLKELSLKFREYADEERFEDVRARYQELADLWAARASMLEKRGNAIQDFYDPEVVAYLEHFNKLVDRLLPVLDVEFAADGENAPKFSFFTHKLTEHLNHLRSFSSSITTWRDAALKDATNLEVRPDREERKAKEKFEKIGAEIVPDPMNPRMISLKQGVGKNLVERDTILIVRLEPATKNVVYLGTAERQQDGKFMLQQPEQTQLTGQERALLPGANLTSDFQSKGSLRDALQVIERNHRTLLAQHEDTPSVDSVFRNLSPRTLNLGTNVPATEQGR